MATHYFSPGPASLPGQVRERIHRELLDTFGFGVSIMEISHRSKQYDELNAETLQLIRKVFQVPDTHSVLITPFGAQQHFSLVVHHLSAPGDTIAYTDTGIWAHLAVEEAKATDRKFAMIYDGQPHCLSLGNPKEWVLPKEARYLHLTVNNTVYGTEYARIPDHFEVPLVLDMTSALGARTDIPWDKTALVYASAQKNFGIAGASVVLIRNDILEASKAITKRNQLGNALSYHSIFAAKSALNTPPVFAIYAMNRMLQWMDALGGTPALEKLALEKAKAVYTELDAGFYIPRCVKENRSRHNFVFKLPTPELDEKFIKEALDHHIYEIKGYRNVGGVRCSMYNGVSLESALVFAEFMRDFRKRTGV
jgi:phosphoserine aminotransferase